jgi:hypothetical protein
MPDEEVNELAWECLGYVKSFDMNPEVQTTDDSRPLSERGGVGV